jgi:7-cyano-7-deazaguanine reductase
MPTDSPLGRPTPPPADYAPEVLHAIDRSDGRRELGLTDDLPFEGADLWTAHEVSWLNEQGRPVVATADLSIPATSPSIVESKSLKLYLSSLSAMRHATAEAVAERIRRDLQEVVGASIKVRLKLPSDARRDVPATPPGTCLDDLDIAIDTYELDPELLADSVAPGPVVDETLHTHLLKSNCPVTGQPDWATLIVRYRGGRIDPAALLRYVVSYRGHREFHEQCVERIFVDLHRRCRPEALTVYARYTRRGGVDINPFRSDFESPPPNSPVWRQ